VVVVIYLNIKEGVNGNHATARVVGPFQNLGMDINKERVRGPPAEDCDICGWDVIDEKHQSGAGPNWFVSYLVWVTSEGGFAAKGVTGILYYYTQDVGVGDETNFAIKSNGGDGGGTHHSWHCSKDPLDLSAKSYDWEKVLVICLALGSEVYFLPFFWLTKVTVTNLVLWEVRGWYAQWLCHTIQNLSPPKLMHFVFPTIWGLKYFQEHMA
jgi:hypothetical protein